MRFNVSESNICGPEGKANMIRTRKKLQIVKRMSLCEHTRQLLINRPRPITLAMIAVQVECSESALNALISGKTCEPSVNLIQRLYELLTGQELTY